jgi:ADP-ribosylglycohydrolase/protein-tyrosine phosphatase
MPTLKDSFSSPLRIADIVLGDGEGRLGLTICPGKKDPGRGWNRDLEEDLRVIRNWGAGTVVTLIELHEFEFLKVSRLGELVQELGMRWIHLPIRDIDVPDERFEKEWTMAGPEIHERLRAGENVVIHCRGGLGRTGLVVGLILVERGCAPREAIQIVRTARPGAIETVAQEQYVRRANPRTQTGHFHIRSENKPRNSGKSLQALRTTRTYEQILYRAQGCLLGQIAGDALGSQVEFQTPAEIASRYPNGVRVIRSGGTWDTLAGQPTDDSEMALLLARMLVKEKTYDPRRAFHEYLFWLNSGPFDVGNTIRNSLMGYNSESSQANGALMRVSPLGIFGAFSERHAVAKWAQADGELTHPNPICRQGNALFTMAIAKAIRTGAEPYEIYDAIVAWADELHVETALRECILRSKSKPPDDYVRQQGWVLVAFGNALYRLLNTSSFEDAVVDTVMCGGDTDTNAAIVGALAGAVHGKQSVPQQWIDAVLNCRPIAGSPGVRRPRPEIFWPVDSLELAESLLLAGKPAYGPRNSIEEHGTRKI